MVKVTAARNNLLQKEKELETCLNAPYVDLWHLRDLALGEDGLLNDNIRRRAWPLLVGINYNSYNDIIMNNPKRDLSLEEKQLIERDVNRIPRHALLDKNYHEILEFDEEKDEEMYDLVQMKLSNLNLLIVEVISQGGGDLNYYQGFHDVATIVMNVFDSQINLASKVLLRLCHSHFRDSLKPEFSCLIEALKMTFYPLLSRLDPKVYSVLKKASVHDPFFSLSWVITWFSHDIKDTATVKRIFDAMIASHPLFIIYLSVSLLLHPFNRKQILRPHNEHGIGNTDPDFAIMHNRLTALPLNCYAQDEYTRARVSVQELIDSAIVYMRLVTPMQLIHFAATKHTSCDFSSIELLKITPHWLIPSESPSDWYAKQRRKLKEKTKKAETSNILMEDYSSIRKKQKIVHSEGTCINRKQFKRALITSGCIAPSSPTLKDELKDLDSISVFYYFYIWKNFLQNEKHSDLLFYSSLSTLALLSVSIFWTFISYRDDPGTIPISNGGLSLFMGFLNIF